MNEAISVTKFNSYIKNIFDNEQLLHNVSIMGEIFGVSVSRNVIYFSLKDENSALSCVCFYPNFIDEIVEGDQVVVTGSPNYYIKGGKLNFNVVKVDKVGQGKLYEEFLKLKEKLQSEGLFDLGHKKEMPENIRRIGVITSKEGAVIQDIKNVSWRRNPAVDIVLFNTKVQGNKAEEEIANAIRLLGKYDGIDVIIVARGGGSLEDLWAYNTEVVARAVYECPKPVVSAVGHETDFTIIDFVSDLRAPTPSAAAELLTFNVEDKKTQLENIKNTLIKIADSVVLNQKQILNSTLYKMESLIEKKILENQSMVERCNSKFIRGAESLIEQRLFDLGLLENTLTKANPIEILNKGYAKIEQDGKGINQANQIDFEKNLSVMFKDGVIKAKPVKD